jgi:hypothetical protein
MSGAPREVEGWDGDFEPVNDIGFYLTGLGQRRNDMHHSRV